MAKKEARGQWGGAKGRTTSLPAPPSQPLTMTDGWMSSRTEGVGVRLIRGAEGGVYTLAL